jgi:hypothetical protein
MVLRGEGPLWWQTRSGNTIEPDETWSSWSAALTTQEAVISSPAARFLQFRLKVGGTTRVWNVQAFYLPHNQQAIITEVTVGDDPKAKSTSKAKAAVKSPDPKIPIKWKTDNADGDELRYELWFALEAEGQWIAILDQGEILTKAEYSWDTTAVPSGWYVVKVGASDGGVNDPSMASTHALESRAFLVDNDPPKVTLKAKSAKTEVALSGTVVDDFSEISSIEYSMDGGPWQTLFPEDLIFDEISESFSHTVAGLEAGSHTVTVRGTDRVGNGTSAGAHFTIK